MYPDVSIELSGEQWSFSLFGIFLIDGKYYTGYDSGCSCPDPWEYTTLNDLSGPFTYKEVRGKIRSLQPYDYLADNPHLFIDDKQVALKELEKLHAKK